LQQLLATNGDRDYNKNCWLLRTKFLISLKMLESIQKTQSPLALAPALEAAIKRGEEAVPI
jgi:hypothetical protein